MKKSSLKRSDFYIRTALAIAATAAVVAWWLS